MTRKWVSMNKKQMRFFFTWVFGETGYRGNCWKSHAWLDEWVPLSWPQKKWPLWKCAAVSWNFFVARISCKWCNRSLGGVCCVQREVTGRALGGVQSWPDFKWLYCCEKFVRPRVFSGPARSSSLESSLKWLWKVWFFWSRSFMPCTGGSVGSL